MYSELVEHNVNNRDRIVHVSELEYFSKDRNYDAYCSAFQFDKYVLEYVKIAGGIKGFGEEAGTGKVYSEIMWFDIDINKVNINLIEVQTATKQLIANLNKKYEVYTDDLMIFFSGCKGFHIGLHNKLFDGLIFKGGHDLNDRIKMMAMEIADGVSIDTSIYNKNRIFRIPNSINEKSGLYKIPISYEELCGSIESIKISAKNSRLGWKYNIVNLSPVPRLVEKWQSISIQESTYIREEVDREFFAVPSEGGRNNAFFKQACMLFDHDFDQNAVSDIMEVYRNSANIGSEDPIKPNDLARIIGSAMSTTADNVKKKTEVKILSESKSRYEVGTFADYIDQYHEQINDDSARIWLNSPKEDKVLRGRLRGKVCAMIGYGGTKKSLRALQILLHNIRKTGIRGVYSTMEQSVFELMNRIINYSVEIKRGDGNINGLSTSDLIEEEEHLRKKAGQMLRDQVAPIYGKNLWMTPTTSFVAEEYDQMLGELEAREGKMDMLVIDGLSRMGGAGSEVERTMTAMREIKDLANRRNMFIIVMVHVSRGARLHTRDVRELIRGGEKIIDEVDFAIMRSMIINEEKSSHGKIEYRNDVGWERFYDKRGKGVSIDIIDSFDPKSLALEAINDEPSIHEVTIKKESEEDW